MNRLGDMWKNILPIIILFIIATLRVVHLDCGTSQKPYEVGEWKVGLVQLDSKIVEKTRSESDELVYIYENSYPGQTIKYVNVANLAQQTCGARVSLRAGGVGQNTLMLMLYAPRGHEIRSVIDVWGTEMSAPKTRKMLKFSPNEQNAMSQVKSRYLFNR